ncbi:MAG: YitT family protein [Tissierellaceae bacterium]|nr:YitT family protein [Tissierellaceae bacterium]
MKIKINAKSFLIINIGLLITSLGLYFFLIPSNLAAGGVTGLAIIINRLMPQVPVGMIMIIANIFLFTLAFILIGKEFGGLTIYNSFLLSGFIYIFEMIIPLNGPLIDDLLVNLIYGILISSVGMAIIFNQNASTGGTDIIAKIITKFTHLNIGKSLFIADSLIAIGAVTVLGIEVGLYSLLGILVNSTLIDKVIAGFNTKYQVAIISEKDDIINKFITEEMNRGVTLLNGVGGYSKTEKRVIHTVVPRSEYSIIKHKVMEIDPTAFIWVNLVNEVHGEGYTF